MSSPKQVSKRLRAGTEGASGCRSRVDKTRNAPGQPNGHPLRLDPETHGHRHGCLGSTFLPQCISQNYFLVETCGGKIEPIKSQSHPLAPQIYFHRAELQMDAVGFFSILEYCFPEERLGLSKAQQASRPGAARHLLKQEGVPSPLGVEAHPPLQSPRRLVPSQLVWVMASNPRLTSFPGITNVNHTK